MIELAVEEYLPHRSPQFRILTHSLTQIDSVKQHLIEYGSITPIIALNLYRCFRLSSIIFRLKKRGLDIRTEIVRENGKEYAKYHLEAK